MSEGQKLVITRRGLEAAVSAKEKGIEIRLKWVSVGDAGYTPNKEQQVLVSEQAKSEFNQFEKSGTTLECVALFEGPEEYAIREIGFWLEDGTLFAVCSAPDTILNYKAKNAQVLQPFTLSLSALPSDSVTVVAGTKNLNILMTKEMMMDAVAFVGSQVVQTKQAHLQMKLAERIRLLEV